MGYAIIEERLTEEEIERLTGEYSNLKDSIKYLASKLENVPGCPPLLAKAIRQATKDIEQKNITPPPYTQDMCKKDLMTIEAVLNLTLLGCFIDSAERSVQDGFDRLQR